MKSGRGGFLKVLMDQKKACVKTYIKHTATSFQYVKV